MTFTRKTLAAGIALGAGLALTACGSTAPPAGSVTHSAAAGALTQDQVIAQAPVAKSLPSSPTIESIKSKGALPWGGSAARPLFSQFDPATNEYEGFEAGLAYMFAKYVLGKPAIAFTQISSTNREALLENGTVDFVCGSYAITPQREKVVAFAGPYWSSGTAVVLPKDSAIKSLDDLSGKPVAVLSGLTETALLQAVPKANAIPFDGTTELVSTITQGRAVAGVMDQASALGAVADNPSLKLLSAKPFNVLDFGIGVPKSDPVFKGVVNDWLAQIETDGEYTKLWKATVGDVAPVPTPPRIGKP